MSAGHVSARLPGLLRSGRSFGAARHVVQTQLSPVVGVPPGTTGEVSPLLVSVFCCLHAQANFFFFLHGVNCSGSWFPLHTMDTISGTCELCSNERLRYLLQVCDVTERATHRSPGALVERRPRLQLARWLPVGERTVSRKG